MFEIEDLFELSLDGAFKDLEEFKNFANGVDYETLFSVIKPGAFKDLEEFKSSLSEKKNQVDTPSDGQEEVTESITETPTEPGSLDSSQENVEIPVNPLIKDDTELLIPEAPSRSGTLKNEDGSVSTHKMKTETDGQGNWFSFPTVFQNEDGSFVDMSEQAKQNWEPVYEEAKKRGEVIEFGKDEKSALAYGKGSWKPKSSVSTIELIETDGVLTDLTSNLLDGLLEKRTLAVKKNKEREAKLSQAPSMYRSMLGDDFEAKDDDSLLQIDEVLKEKILNDFNIKKALENEIIDLSIIDGALKGNENDIATLRNLGVKSSKETQQEIDEGDLNNPYKYEGKTNIITPDQVEGSSVNSMYNTSSLLEIEGMNILDLDGYLNEKEYKNQYLEFVEKGIVSSDQEDYNYTTGYSPALASERIRLEYLTNYVNNQVERNVKSQILNYQLENDGKLPYLDGVELDFTSGINEQQLTAYIQEQFPLMTSKLKEQDAKNQELYQAMKNGESRGGTQAIKQGWRSVEDRINNFSSATYDFVGADDVSNQIRMAQAETELDRGDFLRYTFASGKEADVDGTVYLVDGEDQIYDTELNLRVTNVITEQEAKKIRKAVATDGVEGRTFSKAGAAITTAGIASDMILQIALTRKVGVAGQGASAFLSAFDRGSKIVNIMSKVPMKATTASAMIAQGTLFSTNLAEQTRRQALSNGLSVSQAEELSSIAGIQGFALGSLTAPISTQTYAMDKIFGKAAKDKIVKGAAEAYVKNGRQGAINFWTKVNNKALEYVKKTPLYGKEGAKEVVQENVQQSGQAFVIGENINEAAGREIMNDTITGDQFINTTILSLAAGFMMPIAGDVTADVKTNFNKRFRPGVAAIDRMEALYTLSKDVDKTTQLLNSQVTKGVYTEEQVAQMLESINIYRSTINLIPSNLSSETALSVMQDIDAIKKLENKTIKPSEDYFNDNTKIEEQIQALRNNIITKTNFDNLSNKGKRKYKEEAGRQLFNEARERGEQIIEIDNDQITERAIQNFQNTIEDTAALASEKSSEPQASPDVEEKERFVTDKQAEKVNDLINRPVTLTKLGGSKLDTPIEGDMYVDGQQVVVEDSEGNIIEIGNVDEISNQTLEEIGLEQQVSNVKTDNEGNLQVFDDVLVPDKGGIKRNKRGDVSRVVLRSPDGSKTVTLRGVNAEEAAYQILLNEAQSPEQEQKINELLENDEEFQNELRQVENNVEAETNQDTQQTSEQSSTTEKRTEEEVTKQKEDAISKPSTKEQVLPDAPTSTEGGKDSEVELQQVGEGDVEQVTPDTQVQEGETQTDKPSDTTTETDVEFLKPNAPDSAGRYENYSSDKVEVNISAQNDQGQPSTGKKTDYRFEVRVNTSQDGQMTRSNALTKTFKTSAEAKAYAEKIAANDAAKTKKTDTEQVTQPSEVVYEMNKTDKKIWSKDFEIIDNRNGLELGKDAGKWVVYNRVTGESVDAKSKKDAKDIVNNAPAYAGIFGDGTTVDSEMIVTPSTEGMSVKGSKKAPKILGNKPKMVTVNEYNALKTQIKLEARAAREAQQDLKKKRKAVNELVKLFSDGRKGQFSPKQLQAVINRSESTNFYSRKSVDEFLDYMEKVFDNAEHISKEKEGVSIKTKIKNKINKDTENSLKVSAKEFLKLDPKKVSDIDEYLNYANTVLNGLGKTKVVTKKGEKQFKVADPFNIQDLRNYTIKQNKIQADNNLKSAREYFTELTGLDSDKMTIEEMQDLINKTSEVPALDKEKIEKNKKEIKKALLDAIEDSKSELNSKTQTLNLNVNDKSDLKELLDLDINKLDTKKKMELLDILINFNVNGSLGGAKSFIAKARGNEEMENLVSKGIKSVSSTNSAGRSRNDQLTSLPLVFELMFKGQSKAREVMNALGFNDLMFGSNKAKKDIEKSMKEYSDVFGKIKTRKGKYFDQYNTTERGIIAELLRIEVDSELSEQQQFNNTKSLIKQTYEAYFNTGNKLDNANGKIIEEIYNKLVDKSSNIAELESKVDPANLKGVNYVIENIWGELRPQLVAVQKSIYNENLSEDINFTPRTYFKITQEETDEKTNLDDSFFEPKPRKNPYDKKSSTLMKANRSGNLPKGRVLNLGFDSNNFNKAEAALTDVLTASAIRQIQGALNSDSFNKVFPTKLSRDVVKQRIIDYVDAKRGKKDITEKDQRFLRRLNRLAGFGVAKVLAGVTQPLKQLVPLANTSINAGPANTYRGIMLLINGGMKIIDESGMPIANRGIMSQADIEGLNTLIEKAARTKGGQTIDFLDKANKKLLDVLLVKSDVVAARASFLAYYMQAMNKKGVASNDIDWTKPLERDAKTFAQQQVDRQQNTSDSDLQGRLFTSQRKEPQVLRKVLFPFANFLINQKNRMYSDVSTLFYNPDFIKGDKTAAARSLVGLSVETAIFNTLGYYISTTLASIISSFMGGETPEEEEKRKMYAKRGRIGSVVADIAVPLPFLNDTMLSALNTGMELLESGDEEGDPFRFFAKDEKGLLDQLGVLGITPKKALLLYEMIDLYRTGVAKNVYMGKKSTANINEDAREKMGIVASTYLLSLLGGGIAETNYMAERALKLAKKTREGKALKIVPFETKSEKKRKKEEEFTINSNKNKEEFTINSNKNKEEFTINPKKNKGEFNF